MDSMFSLICWGVGNISMMQRSNAGKVCSDNPKNHFKSSFSGLILPCMIDRSRERLKFMHNLGTI